MINSFFAKPFFYICLLTTFYFKIVSAQDQMTVYRVLKDDLIDSIEHYQKEADGSWHLEYAENFSWEGLESHPEDSEGQTFFEFSGSSDNQVESPFLESMSVWDNLIDTFYSTIHYLQLAAHQAKLRLGSDLKLPPQVSEGIEKVGKTLLGESMYLLMGPHYEKTEIDSYGQREIEKVRVTFINGILNSRTLLNNSLQSISESHGDVKIHYVFRPTEGWTWDIVRGVMIKTTFIFGFRSQHAHLLANLWHNLIQDMGGVEGGGTIIHYAHSLGGSETDRARTLLPPEEQKMIRVITFGTATLVRKEGYQLVTHHVSVSDGVCYLDPFGRIRNFFDPNTNIIYHPSTRWFPVDHLLSGSTYAPILKDAGNKFLEEFDKPNTENKN